MKHILGGTGAETTGTGTQCTASINCGTGVTQSCSASGPGAECIILYDELGNAYGVSCTDSEGPSTAKCYEI